MHWKSVFNQTRPVVFCHCRLLKTATCSHRKPIQGESRVELLAWLNNLLQLNYTKIEQLGTGAAYCQVLDSIYGDVAMHRVKFDAKHEYEYVANFKTLQVAFDTHKIDKSIPVERLVKCKFQDNIEFCQWMKKFHDTYWPGGHYDAIARRKSTGAKLSKSNSSNALPINKPSSPRSSTSRLTSNRNVRGTGPASSPAPSSSSSSSSSNAAASRRIAELTKQLEEMKTTISGLETERDFYFGKLRDIEIIAQTRQATPEVQSDALLGAMLKEITEVLYSTEEGFEVPEEDVTVVANGDQRVTIPQDNSETF